jgi:hypothetical protein
MAIDTLMTGGSHVNPAFGLEHRASHQIILEKLPQNVQYTIEPAYFDPRSIPAGTPASYWQLKHQDAHNVMAQDLPPFYGAPTVGMNAGQNLVDQDLEEPTGLTWSLFVNLQLHYAAMLSIGP